MVSEAARNVNAKKSIGNDDFRHRSKDSAKVMKMPNLY